VLFVGNKTDICVFSKQTAYIAMLNINAVNITLLFPNHNNSMNYIQKEASLCSGDIDIYEPEGTEMVSLFVLKDKKLLSQLGYSISKRNPYFTWEYENGKAIQFCEDILLKMVNTPKEKWSVENSLIRIKKN